MSADDVPWALFEPEAGALLARAAVSATIDRFAAEGGEVLVARVTPVEPAGNGSGNGDGAAAGADGAGGIGRAGGAGTLGRVTLEDGPTLEADAFVFAAGPWLPDLFPATLGPLITPHRQDVM
jgi:hypothetical protein